MIKLKCILQPQKIQNRDGGKFMFDIQEEFDGKLHWKGSKNQRVIDVQETLRRKEIVLCEF